MVFFLFPPHIGKPENEEKYCLEQNLSSENFVTGWLTQADQTGELTPYFPLQKTNQICQWIPLSHYRNSYLSFFAYKELSLFIDNKLVWVADKDRYYKLKIQEEILLDSVSGSRQNQLILFWHPKGKLPVNSFEILHKLYSERIQNIPKEKPLRFMEFKNNFMLGLLSILFLISVSTIFLKGNFNNATLLLWKDNPGRDYDKTPGFFFNFHQLVFFTILLLTLSWHWIVFEYYTGKVFFIQNFFFFIPWWKAVAYSGIILVCYVLKFSFYKMSGFILQQSRLFQRMFGLVFQWDFIIGLFLFAGLLTLYALPSRFFWIWLYSELIFAVLFLAFRYVRIYKSLVAEKSFYRYHLFFYLCTLELVPLGIISRIFISAI